MKTVRTLVRQIEVWGCVPLLIVFAGCSAPTSAKGKLIKEAGEYALALRSDGKLPGFSSGEHGREMASAAWEVHGAQLQSVEPFRVAVTE